MPGMILDAGDSGINNTKFVLSWNYILVGESNNEQIKNTCHTGRDNKAG